MATTGGLGPVLILAEKPRFALALRALASRAGIASSLASSQAACRFGTGSGAVRRVPTPGRLAERETIEAVRLAMRRCGATRLVAGDTPWTRWLSAHACSFPGVAFPTSPRTLFDSLFDKGSFADIAREAGVAHPPTTVVRTTDEASEVEGRGVGGPWMVKPCWGEGGMLVSRAGTLGELGERVGGVLASGSRRVLVQSYIPGRDVDLSLLAERGALLASCVQRNTTKRGGPRTIEFLEDSRVTELGRRLCAHTGYHGVAHLDMRIDDRKGEPVVIEFNPRFWASAEAAATAQPPAYTGLNFLALGLSVTGGPARERARSPRRSA